MASFYDVPAQSNVVPTYVPIPFEEIVQAGQARQKRQDEAMAAMLAQEQALQSLPYAPIPEHEAYVKQSISDVDKIARSASKLDLSQGINRRRLQDQLRNVVDLNQLSKIARSKENFEKARQQEFQLRMAGKYYEPYERTMDPYYTGGLGLNEYNYTPQAFQDPEQLINQMFESVKPSTYLGTTDIGGRKGVVEYTHRPLKDLKRAIDTEGNTFLQRPEAQFMVDQYRRINDIPQSEMSDKEIMNNILEQRAEKYIIPASPNFASWVPEDTGSDKSVIPPLGASNNTQAMPNINRISVDKMKEEFNVNPEKIKDPVDLKRELDFGNNGELRPKKAKRPIINIPTSAYEKAKAEGKTKAEDHFAYAQELKQKEFDAGYSRQRKLIDTLKQSNPRDFGNDTDFDVLNKYFSAYNKLEQTDYNIYLYDTSEGSRSIKATLSDMVRDDLGTRALYLADNKEGHKPVQLDELYDKLGIKKGSDDRDLSKVKITAIVPSLGGYQASIEHEGIPRNFIISPNKEEQWITDLAVEANKINESGKIGDTPIRGTKFVVSTILKNEEDQSGNPISGQYEFASVIKTKDGSPIFEGTDINEIGLGEYENMVAGMLQQIY